MRDLRKAPRRYGPVTSAGFRFLRWAGGHLWPGKRWYRRRLARGGLAGSEVTVSVSALPTALEGLRLVQLSDLHAGPFLDEASLDPVVDLARAYEPDVLVVTGDFITHVADEAHELGDALARIDAPGGKFAVFGNHDYRERREGEIAACLRRAGVRTLRNASALVEREGAAVRVVGLEDIEESRRADLDAALAGARADDAVTVLLCHHPDVADALPAGRFDLVLCGHTHGGQIRLPLVGSPARRWLPSRVRGAHALDGGGLVYVNRGIGVLVLPFRVGATAEVTCFVLRRA